MCIDSYHKYSITTSNRVKEWRYSKHIWPEKKQHFIELFETLTKRSNIPLTDEKSHLDQS